MSVLVRLAHDLLRPSIAILAPLQRVGIRATGRSVALPAHGCVPPLTDRHPWQVAVALLPPLQVVVVRKELVRPLGSLPRTALRAEPTKGQAALGPPRPKPNLFLSQVHPKPARRAEMWQRLSRTHLLPPSRIKIPVTWRPPSFLRIRPKEFLPHPRLTPRWELALLAPPSPTVAVEKEPR